MINLNTQFLSSHFLDSLGWAIVHSLWQGVIALSLVLMFRALSPNKSPASQYIVQITCLSLCFISFLITFALYYGTPISTATTIFEVNTAPLFGDASIGNSFEFSSIKEGLSGIQISSITPLFGIIWCIGFLLMATRYFGAFYLTQQLKEKGTSPVTTLWINRFRELARDTGVTNKVRLLISKHVDGPLTIGFFKTSSTGTC